VWAGPDVLLASVPVRPGLHGTFIEGTYYTNGK
jgi:hypothetical protein